MDRSLRSAIQRDLGQKIVLISGPRQCGKTTLAKMLSPTFAYLNYDHPEHRAAIRERSWDRRQPFIIFDELHKMRSWKAWLKGIYDVEGVPPAIVVTGSARLDAARRAGESMAGRYFSHRLHPLDVKEAAAEVAAEEALRRILLFGGFPEPFLRGDSEFYARWRRTHQDIILRQDLVDLEGVRQIAGVESLLLLLRGRVGGTVSHANLARDLDVDPKTVTKWLGILESLYVVFSVAPHSRRVSRSLLKAKKYYFFDTGQVGGDDGARLENAVAGALLKEVHRLEDQTGARAELRFVRTKEGKEIDFAVVVDGVATHLIEVKNADPEPSPSLRALSSQVGGKPAVVQLVRELERERTYPDGLEVRRAAPWLASLDLGGPVRQP